MAHRHVGILIIATTFACTTWGAAADGPNECAKLADQKIENANLLSSTVIPASDDLPEYCRVLGYVRPAINFEVRLPTENWNGKFYMAGCGGWCGRLQPDRPGFTNAMNHGLRRNYAAVTMDGGHWGLGFTDLRWAHVKDPIARFDFEQRAVTETARVSKEIVGAYYGKLPEKSYFAGCSNGGRQAHMEAWKYPKDFDGIISGAPWLNAAGLQTAGLWNIRANTDADGTAVLDPSKLSMIGEAVYDACAGKDGLIEKPDQCAFEPESLECNGVNGPECLTTAEVQTLNKFYKGPTTSDGVQLYPGIPLGSAPYWSFWLGLENEQAWKENKSAWIDELHYYGFSQDPGPEYDVADFDFDKDPPQITGYKDLEAGGTDLSEFQERGGKLLIYHGLADPLLVAEATRQWYDLMMADTGDSETTSDFARLFLVPGMDHCGIQSDPGVGHAGFDPLPALEKWVEEGVAPESIIMTKTHGDNSDVEWTRPVCAYPSVAEYAGSGGPSEAENWRCVGPYP